MLKSVDHSYQFGPFRLYPAKRLLTRDDLPVTLASKAFDTLLALVEGRGRILDKDDLMQKIWPNSVVEENNLAQHIAALRKILGESKDTRPYIVTVPGRGYQFVAPVQELWDDTGPELEKHDVVIDEDANG